MDSAEGPEYEAESSDASSDEDAMVIDENYEDKAEETSKKKMKDGANNTADNDDRSENDEENEIPDGDVESNGTSVDGDDNNNVSGEENNESGEENNESGEENNESGEENNESGEENNESGEESIEENAGSGEENVESSEENAESGEEKEGSSAENEESGAESGAVNSGSGEENDTSVNADETMQDEDNGGDEDNAADDAKGERRDSKNEGSNDDNMEMEEESDRDDEDEESLEDDDDGSVEGDDDDESIEGDEDGSEEGEDWETDEEGESGEEDGEVEGEDEASQTLEAIQAAVESDSGEDVESCPICLNKFRGQDVGTPESCDHNFCLDCIMEWANNVNTCPVDRQVFHLILAKHSDCESVYKRFPVEDKSQQESGDEVEELTFCEVCHRCDREDRLLLCDGCDLGYHCECLDPPLESVPIEEWFCPDCVQTQNRGRTGAQVSDGTEGATCEESEEDLFHPRPFASPRRRRIPRTQASERVRTRIQATRAAIARMFESEDEEMELTCSSSTISPRKPTARKKTTRKKTTKARKGKKSTKKRTTGKKTVRKRRRRRRRTVKGKGKAKKVRRKSTKRKTKKLKLPSVFIPATTPKARLAGKLGLSKPPMGRTIPMQKVAVEKTMEGQRVAVGISALSIMGDRDELLSFNEGEDSQPGTSAPVDSKKKVQPSSKYSMSAIRSHRPVARPHISRLLESSDENVSALAHGIEAPSTSAGPLDVLGSIMQEQNLLSMKGQDITINRDGSLTAKKPIPESTVKEDETEGTTTKSAQLQSSSANQADDLEIAQPVNLPASSEKEVKPDTKASLASDFKLEKSDSEDVGRSPYTDSDTDDRPDRNGRKREKTSTSKRESTETRKILEHCNPEKLTEPGLGDKNENNVTPKSCDNPAEDTSPESKESVIRSVEEQVRALYSAAENKNYSNEKVNIFETKDVRDGELKWESGAESLGENAENEEVENSVTLDQLNESAESLPAVTAGVTNDEKESAENSEKESEKIQRSISPVSYDRRLSVDSDDSAKDGVCDSRPRVPISELPRIPKKKKVTKAIEIITIDDDEEVKPEKTRGVLQRLDLPENRNVWENKDRQGKKDEGKSSSASKPSSEVEVRDRHKGSSRTDRRREISDEDDERGRSSHVDRRHVMLNERGGLIVRTEDASHPESSGGHSLRKHRHSGERSRSKSKERSSRETRGRSRSRSRERREDRDRTKSKEESRQRSRSRDRSRRKRRHDRSRSGSRSDHGRYERSYRRRKKKRDRSVEDGTRSDRRSYEEDEDSEHVHRRDKREREPRSSKGDTKERTEHRDKTDTKDKTTSWEKIDSKDKTVSRDRSDSRDNKSDSRREKRETPKEKMDLREKLDSRNKGDLREKLDNRLKGDLREKIDSRLKSDALLRDKLDFKVKSDVTDVRRVEDRQLEKEDGWHSSEMLTGYKRSFDAENDSADTKRRKEENVETETKKKNDDPPWVTEHSSKLDKRGSELTNRVTTSSSVSKTSPPSSVQFKKDTTPVKSASNSPQENLAASPFDMEHSNSNSPVCPAISVGFDPNVVKAPPITTTAPSVSPGKKIPVRSQPLLPTPLSFLKLHVHEHPPPRTQMGRGMQPVDSLYDPAMPTDMVSPTREFVMKEEMNSLGLDLVQRQELLFKDNRIHSPNPPPSLLGEAGSFMLPGHEPGMINVLQPHQNMPIPMTLGLLPPGYPPPGLHSVQQRPHLVMNPLLLNRPPPTFRRIPQMPSALPGRFPWPGMPGQPTPQSIQGVLPMPNPEQGIASMQNRFPTNFPPPSGPPPSQASLVNGGFDPIHSEAGIRAPFPPPIFHSREDPRQILLPPPNIRGPPPTEVMERPPEPTISAPPAVNPTRKINPLNEISKLLNLQAQLVGGLKKRDGKLVSAGKNFVSDKPGKGLFKVPLPPPSGTFSGTPIRNNSGQMTGNTKMSPGNQQSSGNETMEVVDMDMSPLEDDVNIVMSPEYDKDEKEDKVSDIVFLATKADDVPSSAVELTNKEKAGKYMKKLHLQERVVEEVKLAIKPFYSKKQISKEEYKDILRKSVPKICHSKSGDINPVKIKSLVEAYVEKLQRAKEKKISSKANGERSRPKVSR